MRKLKKYELFEIANHINFLINRNYKIYFQKIIEQYNIEIDENKLSYFKKVKEDIFGDESLIKTNIFLIVAKSNCICWGENSRSCYNINCKNSKSLIELGNWNESKLKHLERSIKGQAKSFIKFSKSKKKNKISITDKQNEIFEIDFNNISNKNSINVQKEKSIYDILLYDLEKLKNIYNIIQSDSFEQLSNNGEFELSNEKLEKYILSSLSNHLLLDGKLEVLYNLFKFGKKLNPKDSPDAIFKLTKKIEDYIDTTYGAGLYYLKNTKISGFVSFASIKQAFKEIEDSNNKSNIRFTEDHIYRRKLASSFLRSKVDLTLIEFQNLYKNRFSYISFLTSEENSSIKDWVDDPDFMNIPIQKFQKKYNTAINKKGVELINTKIMSEGNLKTFINFLYLNEIKAKGINIINIDIKTVREWFNKFQKSRIIVGLD